LLASNVLSSQCSELEEIEKIILLSSGFECSIAFFMNLSMMGEILL
jgi:hypothetical protein